ncbi:MAG: tetratricopeptide repeat protein [Bacteroidia bacterium]|nr:tetratricopeptide repeat protein [Bacteroidia bacterium]MDW8158197.1 tetratricopeptide repeat protein [Bacteroidia bacterium]
MGVSSSLKGVGVETKVKETQTATEPRYTRLSWKNLYIQIFILVVAIFLAYGNAIRNDFAFDDGLQIHENEFTMKGIAGIRDILIKNTLAGHPVTKRHANRYYRPLSTITFAIEYQFFQANPHIYHFNNIILFAISVIILLLLLRNYVFPKQHIASFATALIFALHPIHTEGVTNLKGRDEVLSFLLLILSLYLCLEWLNRNKIWLVPLALFCYFLALLSKENGITFLAILPLSLFYFTRKKISTIGIITALYAIVVLFYFLIRIKVIGFDLANKSNEIIANLYLNSPPEVRYATSLVTLGMYIRLLFFPHPLSSDYNYKEIEYRTFSDGIVWVWFLMHAVLCLWALWQLRHKNKFAYAILFFYCSASIASNLFIDTGVVAERMIYQASLGIALVTGLGWEWGLSSMARKFSFFNYTTIAAFIIVLVLLGYKTYKRNPDWYDNKSLFLADVKNAPNSALTNCGAGMVYMSYALDPDTAKSEEKFQKYWNLGVHYLQKSLSLHPKYHEALDWMSKGYIQKGLRFYNAKQYDSAYVALKKAIEYNPANPLAWSNLAVYYLTVQKYREAINCYNKAIPLNPNFPEYYYNMGVAYYQLASYDTARALWQKTLQLDPKNPGALNAMKTLESLQPQQIKIEVK